MKRYLAILLLVLPACGLWNGGPDDSVDRAGPGDAHAGAMKTPEAIAETISLTWGVELTSDERLRYIDGLRAVLGGVVVSRQTAMARRPNELSVLALSALSHVLADKLVARQIDQAAQSKPFLFEGLGWSEPDTENCYSDDSKDWCDSEDGVQVGSLTDAGVDPGALSKAWKKRVMRNIQAVAEFFLLSIDNLVPLTGFAHAPEYLFKEVFLPKLLEAPLSKEQEAKAWREVVFTVLMGGGYYLET